MNCPPPVCRYTCTDIYAQLLLCADTAADKSLITSLELYLNHLSVQAKGTT